MNYKLILAFISIALDIFCFMEALKLTPEGIGGAPAPATPILALIFIGLGILAMFMGLIIFINEEKDN